MESSRLIRITNLCALFYRAEGIPITLYNPAGNCEVCYPLEPARMPGAVYHAPFEEKKLDVVTSPSHGAYGWLPLDEGWHLMVGPAYNVPISEQVVSAFMQENYIASAERQAAQVLLNATPRISLLEFFDKFSFLYYCIKEEVLDPAEYFDLTDQRENAAVSQESTLTLVDRKENGEYHNTYQWEQQFYRLIQDGNEEKLVAFIMQDNAARLTRGILADTPLRQAKNIFIGGITKVGVLAAIPAGMDIEQTYQLLDTYIIACEHAMTVTEIDRLHFTAVTDFCRRIGAEKLPQGVSREIYTCMCFIRNHTNLPLCLEDVANSTGRSVSYTGNRFKAETGSTIGAYITHCRLMEAENLLAYTNMTLTEISSYLCFSSQSYFQNVFKKKYGVTPMQYRKQHHI